MAYIGAEPLPGQNREVDDISSSFNGSTTAFTLQVSGVNVSPESPNSILVNIGGILQNPGTDYTIAASTITFTTAPASGLSFFAIILGAGINTATVADQTIGTSKVLDNAITADKLAHTSVTAGSYTTADITVDAQGRITAAASGSISGAEIADGAVTTAKIADSTGASDGVTTAKIATSAITTAKIADQAVDLTKLPHGTSSNDGKFLRANNGADPTFETVSAGTSLSGSTNNTITTVTGANAIQGEANLTFDGTTLTVTGSNEANMLHFATGNSAGNTFASVRGDNESGIKIRGGGSYGGGTIELGGGLRDTNPGIITFSTGTGTTVTERMRIASGGAVTFNATGDVGGTQTGVRIQDPEIGTCRFAVSTTASDTHIQFLNNNANSVVGSVTTVSSSTAYNTSSDYRLKENVSSISDGITRLKTLKPSRFNFKADTDKTLDGFLAHEVTAVPEAITGEKDAVAVQADVDKGISDKVGDPIYQQIDQSKLVPLLTAALQEAITKIETLETKVAALEAA